MYGIAIEKSNITFALAVASGVALLLSAVIAVVWAIVKKIPCHIGMDVRLIKKLFATGFPASVAIIFYSLSQLLTTTICLKLPPDAYTAKIYISQVVVFVYQFGYAVGQANSILIGYLCGMGKLDEANKMQMNNMKIILICNLFLSVLFALFSKVILTVFFNASKEVLAYAIWIFWIDVFVEFGRGMNHAGQFGLNAAGDVHFTTIVSSLGCWIASVGLSFVFVYFTPLGLYGIWISFALDENFRGWLYFFRWKTGAWRKKVQKI